MSRVHKSNLASLFRVVARFLLVFSFLLFGTVHASSHDLTSQDSRETLANVEELAIWIGYNNDHLSLLRSIEGEKQDLTFPNLRSLLIYAGTLRTLKFEINSEDIQLIQNFVKQNPQLTQIRFALNSDNHGLSLAQMDDLRNLEKDLIQIEKDRALTHFYTEGLNSPESRVTSYFSLDRENSFEAALDYINSRLQSGVLGIIYNIYNTKAESHFYNVYHRISNRNVTLVESKRGRSTVEDPIHLVKESNLIVVIADDTVREIIPRKSPLSDCPKESYQKCLHLNLAFEKLRQAGFSKASELVILEFSENPEKQEVISGRPFEELRSLLLSFQEIILQQASKISEFGPEEKPFFKHDVSVSEDYLKSLFKLLAKREYAHDEGNLIKKVKVAFQSYESDSFWCKTSQCKESIQALLNLLEPLEISYK
jgi:hypothetical protein